jgi:hypothetical protein
MFDHLRQRVSVNNGVVVQQPHKLAIALSKGKPHAHVASRGKATIAAGLDQHQGAA